MRPLYALLSQVLVAYTIEADNRFERAMVDADYPGRHLSLLLWSNLIRFVGDRIALRQLARTALTPESDIKHQLGCLERWGVVTLDEPDGGSAPKKRERHREGWGSGSGLRADWIVRLTETGEHARSVWPGIIDAVDANWHRRLGATRFMDLRETLTSIVASCARPLPDALPMPDLRAGYAPYGESKASFPTPGSPSEASIATILSNALLMFAIEFDRAAPVPIELSANLLRVLAEGPVQVNELAQLTGLPPECADIGWQEKPLVTLAPKLAKARGKVVALSAAGRAGFDAHERLVPKLEREWEQRFGKANLARLRDALLTAFDDKSGRAPILEALTPPEHTLRAGAHTAALGRRDDDIGPAAVKRARELVAQTRTFLENPATLPHFPRWDMNRGFGP